MTQTIINLGTGGAALNGQNGSTAGADSNDALFLDWAGDNYVYLSGVADNALQVPDANALDITGDIDIRVRVALDSATSAGFGRLISKREVSTNISYDLDYGPTGVLTLTFSTNGTTGVERQSTAALPVTVVGNAIWIRATLDVDNGASGHDVKFFTSTDAVTWNQLGSTVTTAGVVSIFSGAANLTIGSLGTGFTTAGKFYRAQIFDGIEENGGTKVLDVDTSVITAGNATSFTALTGQTVTINRSTSGRKSVAVVSPVWLFGTDDYMEVADNALLDFDASDSFTIVAAYRAWATLATNVARVAKKANTTAATQGWLLGSDGTTATLPRLQAGDGVNGASATGPARTSGALTITAGVRNVATDTLTTYLNSTAGTAVTDTTTGSLANAEVVRIGRLSGAGTGYADMELIAVAVFRRALSAAEISAVTSYYQARLS
jgi:hypothetical protein